LEDAAAESGRRVSGAFNGTDEVIHEFVEVREAAIRQVVLSQGPNALLGI
jgi:hypothetical protein